MIYDLISEYYLIAKNLLTGIWFVDFPKKWKMGVRGKIIILQGINEKPNFLTRIAERLHKSGFGIETVYSQKETENTVEDLANKVVQLLDKNTYKKIIIVAHSKGGLVAKYLMDNYPNINKKIIKAICIACPWKGSYLGLVRFHNLYQMIPNSNFLNNLLEKTINNGKIVNIYPIIDNHVIPNKNLILEGAKNMMVDIIGHTRILASPTTLELIRKEVE